MEKRENVIRAVQDLVIARYNLLLAMDELTDEVNINFLQELCDDMMKRIEAMIQYNDIQENEINFDI